MYIKLTNIDAATKKLCTDEPMRLGPDLPYIESFKFDFSNESIFPIETDSEGVYLQLPLYYGTCDDDADTSLNGIIAILTEEQYNAEKEIEHQARKPYPSWVGDLVTMSWNPPVPYPQDGNFYQWDEPTVSWVLVSTSAV